ncbi:helix-turn-helix transcriptional regulator [Mariniluteicoccus flavus]
MAAHKSERVLNLTICLLATSRYLTREQIRGMVEGYGGSSQENFERMFERDKDELRNLGVPIETGPIGAEDETGYRIRRTDFELPPVEFTSDEAAVMAVAGRVWQEARLAGSTASAMGKLRAAGLEPDADRLRTLTPVVAAREAAFEPLWQAVVTRTPVGFGYRTQRRSLEPWGITSHRGAWYVIGHDRDRDAPRMFKLARITDMPEPIGEPGAYAVPADLDIRDLARSLDPAEPSREAVVAVRGHKAPDLRRRGVAVEPPVALPTGFTTWRVAYADREDIVAEIAASGSDVIVCDPPELRTAVRRHLRAVVGRSGVPGSAA